MNGMNNKRIPIMNAIIEESNTPAAAMSFAFFINFFCIPLAASSPYLSMAVLNSSATKTNPVTRIIMHHFVVERFR